MGWRVEGQLVITGHRSESVAFARWQQRTSVNKSVAFAKGRGLLWPTPQLVNIRAIRFVPCCFEQTTKNVGAGRTGLYALKS